MATKSRPDRPTWQFYMVVRVYTGPDVETKKRTYLNQTIYGACGCSRLPQEIALKATRRTGPRDEGSTRRSKRSINTWTAGLNFVRSRGLRAKSLKDYEGLLRVTCVLDLAPKALASISAFDIQTLYGDLLVRGPVGPLDPLYPCGFAVGAEAGDALEPHPVKPSRIHLICPDKDRGHIGY